LIDLPTSVWIRGRPASHAEAAEAPAAGCARGQRLRRQECHVRLHSGGCVQERRRSL